MLLEVALPLLFGVAAAAVAFFGFYKISDKGKIKEAEIMAQRLAEPEDNIRIDVDYEIARMVAISKSRTDFVLVLNPKGIVTFCNEQLASFLSTTPQLLTGRPWQSRMTSRKDIQKRADVYIFEEALETDKGVFWFEWMEQTITIAKGEATETLRVGRDISRKRSEQSALAEARARAEAANESKSRFLATVSHEIRTPLSGVLGMADLLQDTGLTPEQKTYVNAIGTSGKALLSLIDDILDFSKIEAGHLDLTQAPFDLEQLLESTVELLSPRAQDKGLEIASLIAPQTPKKLLGDSARLRQVLLNLAGNSIKFTDKGGVGIRASRIPNDQLEITVTDTGVGIMPEAKARIFEEFVQADESTARRYAGTGLGLAISKKLVEKMHGTISVSSEMGKGSVFTVTIPLLPSGQSEIPMPSLEKFRILLCGKSPFELPFMSTQLEALGADVFRAESEDTVQLILRQGSAFDVVVVDAALGLETCKTLVETSRKYGVQRLLVLVSPFEKRDLGAPEHSGFDGYLVKPVRTASMLAYVGERTANLDANLASHNIPTLNPQKQGITLNVLIAEDEDVNALLATKLIEKFGHNALRVKDGFEAVNTYKETKNSTAKSFDLILMDMRMPGLDGLGATQKIRNFEQRNKIANVPIYALTANAFSEDKAACLAAGMDGFLSKPLDKERLSAIIQTIMATSSKQNII